MNAYEPSRVLRQGLTCTDPKSQKRWQIFELSKIFKLSYETVPNHCRSLPEASGTKNHLTCTEPKSFESPAEIRCWNSRTRPCRSDTRSSPVFFGPRHGPLSGRARAGHTSPASRCGLSPRPPAAPARTARRRRPTPAAGAGRGRRRTPAAWPCGGRRRGPAAARARRRWAAQAPAAAV